MAGYAWRIGVTTLAICAAACGPQAPPCSGFAATPPLPPTAATPHIPSGVYPPGAKVGDGVDAAEQRIRAIAVGWHSACAILEDATLWCWGLQHLSRTSVARQVPLAGVEQVDASGRGYCARERSGKVSCWEDTKAMSVVASMPPRSVAGERDASLAPAALVLPKTITAEDVQYGDDVACALVSGVAWCWGNDSLGALGAHESDDTEGRLVRVSLGDTAALRHVTAVAQGREHRCVVVADGTVRCWGDNTWGQLGLSDRTPRVGPTRVPGIVNATDVVASMKSTCVLTKDGDILCFGRQPWRSDLRLCEGDGEFTLGDGAPCSDHPSVFATAAASVAMGDEHACIVTTDGHVRCAAVNDFGEAGAADRMPHLALTDVLGKDGRPLSGVVQLRGFPDHTCAVTTDGKVYCWGRNSPFSEGRAYSTPPTITVATPVPGVKDAADVSDRCVLSTSGALRCWGHAFPDDRDFTYEPRRIGRCAVRELGRGPGMCFVEAGGARCIDGEQSFVAASIATHLVGYQDEACGIGATGELSCFIFQYEPASLIGPIVPHPEARPAADANCAVDPPLRDMPRFPPVPAVAARAYFVPIFPSDVPPPDNDAGFPLSPAQLARLLALLNDPKNFKSTSTCHEPQHVYLFQDATGELVGRVGVGADCTTLESEPHIPVQHRAGGNIVGPKLRLGLIRLCEELHLTHCSAPENDEGAGK